MDNNNQQNNNNKFAAVQYWITLHQFYCKTSTMQIKLINSDATVQVSIAPSLNPNAGRPQAGVASYDYKSAINFNLTLGELQILINAIEQGIVNTGEVVSLFHNFEGGNTILNLQRSQNGALGIAIVKNGANVWYSFQIAKANQKSNTVIPYEADLFVSILKSVLTNLVNIKSKHVYEVVTPSNNNNANRGYTNNNYNQGNASYANQNNNYQQPQQQAYQQPQQQQVNNYQQPQNNGLPQSNNVAQPDPNMYGDNAEF